MGSAAGIFEFPRESTVSHAGIYAFPYENVCVPKQESIDSLMGVLRETMGSLLGSMGPPGVIHGLPCGNLVSSSGNLLFLMRETMRSPMGMYGFGSQAGIF